MKAFALVMKRALSRFCIFQISTLGNLEIFYIPHHQPIQEINLKGYFKEDLLQAFCVA